MKQDWDLIRKILVTTEDQPPSSSPSIEDIAGNRWSGTEVVEHIAMLGDAGYLNAEIIRPIGGAGDDAIVRSITMSGYDLLRDLRNDTVWGKIKALAKERGIEVTLDVIKALGPIAIRAVLGVPQ